MTATNARAQQTERMGTAPGFIAALDQSGGSTPKALKAYGVEPEVYGDDQDKMFDLVHEMRTRIITSPSFASDHILAAILFEMTSCLLYTSPSPRDLSTSRMPSSA